MSSIPRTARLPGPSPGPTSWVVSSRRVLAVRSAVSCVFAMSAHEPFDGLGEKEKGDFGVRLCLCDGLHEAFRGRLEDVERLDDAPRRGSTDRVAAAGVRLQRRERFL